MTRSAALLAAGMTLTLAAAGRAAQVGPAVEVAPRAEKTRQQLWASAAWCAGTESWLVAWREGFLNEPESQIFCARVSADGRALDPTGIALTSGKGLKDQPRVASDGKGWLVVWEDMRNGKDWDVFAARVSAEGKAQEENGFLVAGGAHNQCRPDVTFAKDNYVTAWMGFQDGYGAYCARVSPGGRVLEAGGLELAVLKGGLGSQVITPALASDGDVVLAAVMPVSLSYGRSFTFVRTIDAAGGQVGGPAPKSPEGQRGMAVIKGGGDCDRPPAVAVSEDGAMVAMSISSIRSLLSLAPTDRSGANAGVAREIGAHVLNNFRPRYNLVHDGKEYLLVSDFAALSDRRNEKSARIQVRGWRVGPDGKTSDDPKTGFEVSADPAKDQMLPFVARGPAGTALVVYSEARGADDVKVLARLVKAK